MANLSNPQNPVSMSSMFADPSDDLRREIEERTKKLFAASQSNGFGTTPTPGRISTMMGVNSGSNLMLGGLFG